MLFRPKDLEEAKTHPFTTTSHPLETAFGSSSPRNIHLQVLRIFEQVILGCGLALLGEYASDLGPQCVDRLQRRQLYGTLLVQVPTFLTHDLYHKTWILIHIYRTINFISRCL